MVEQSKLVSNHLLGLVLNDMAYSIPFIRYLNSGQIIALPAYAASTCSQVPASLAIGPISAKLSKETHEVVPKVADTKKGTNPMALSSSMAYKKKWRNLAYDRSNGVGDVKLYLRQSSSAKAQVRIRVEDAQLCEGNHGCFLYAGMSLLGTVGD